MSWGTAAAYAASHFGCIGEGFGGDLDCRAGLGFQGFVTGGEFGEDEGGRG